MHPNSKINPGAYIFQRPLLRGLFLEGLIHGQGKLASPNQWGYRFCVVLLCVVRRTIFQVQAPRVGGGKEGAYLYIWKGDLREGFFCVTPLEGLYLEGLIHGWAYFWSCTVFS